MSVITAPKTIQLSGASRGIPAWPLATVISLIYLILNLTVLLHTVRDPDLAAKMQAKDSRQYIEIAHDFAAGDFRMSYVKNMPHRQPLYPLALAPVIKIWGEDLFKLGAVNIVIGWITLLCLYRGLLGLLPSQLVASLTTLAFIGNPFIIDKIACRLMTEPLHALLLTLLILYFLAYLRKGKAVSLLGVALVGGLDYLARTNGLFVLAATFVTLGVYDVCLLVRPRPYVGSGQWRPWQSLLLRYLGAAAVAIVVITPSWLPRYVYFGDPLHHGYLSNFMWVDSYDQAHTGQAISDYTWKDYTQSHDLRGFLGRWADGFYRVYYDIPRHAEHVRVLYFLAIGGIIVAFARRRWDYCLLISCLFIQLLPVVWTSISTPGPRIAYGTILPFELFLGALCLSYLTPLIARYLPRRTEHAN